MKNDFRHLAGMMSLTRNLGSFFRMTYVNTSGVLKSLPDIASRHQSIPLAENYIESGALHCRENSGYLVPQQSIENALTR